MQVRAIEMLVLCAQMHNVYFQLAAPNRQALEDDREGLVCSVQCVAAAPLHIPSHTDTTSGNLVKSNRSGSVCLQLRTWDTCCRVPAARVASRTVTHRRAQSHGDTWLIEDKKCLKKTMKTPEKEQNRTLLCENSASTPPRLGTEKYALSVVWHVGPKEKGDPAVQYNSVSVRAGLSKRPNSVVRFHLRGNFKIARSSSVHVCETESCQSALTHVEVRGGGHHV